MLSRRLPHPSTSALGRPSAAAAENSKHTSTASALHCTEVCCGLNFAASTPAPHRPHSTEQNAARMAAKFADFVGLGFQQDVEIWLRKTRIDNPLLCAEDGPVYQVRRWYEQFYRDVADIEPDMVARFEFEIDTTRAVAGWEAEVAQNLARQADLPEPPAAARQANVG